MYLTNLLSKYSVNKQNAIRAKSLFLPHIRKWAGSQLLNFDFSGSTAKNTEVSCSSDIDFFISLSSTTSESLETVFNSLYSQLNSFSDVTARKQNVSIGCNWDSLKIDFTPGKKRIGNNNYHSIYKYKNSSWTQTNIQKHINIVKDSGRQNEIKLAKIWRKNHNLSIPSIFLELCVLDALKNKPFNDLSNNFFHFLGELGNRVDTIKIIDPSNTNNIISDDLSTYDKLLIKNQALDSRKQSHWNTIVW